MFVYIVRSSRKLYSYIQRSLLSMPTKSSYFRYMFGAIIGHYAGRLSREPHKLGHGSSVFNVTS